MRGVPCPECGGKSITIDTRTKDDGRVRRRFECVAGHRFSFLNDEPARYKARPKAMRIAAMYTGPILTEWRPFPFSKATGSPSLSRMEGV